MIDENKGSRYKLKEIFIAPCTLSWACVIIVGFIYGLKIKNENDPKYIEFTNLFYLLGIMSTLVAIAVTYKSLPDSLKPSYFFLSMILMILLFCMIGGFFYYTNYALKTETLTANNFKDSGSRTQARGTFASVTSAFIGIGVQLLAINIIGVSQDSYLLWWGFIAGPVLGYMFDIAFGTEEGYQLFTLFRSNPTKKVKGNQTYGDLWANYVINNLGNSQFLRYVVTVFLDLFISDVIQDVMRKYAKPIENKYKIWSIREKPKSSEKAAEERHWLDFLKQTFSFVEIKAIGKNEEGTKSGKTEDEKIKAIGENVIKFPDVWYEKVEHEYNEMKDKKQTYKEKYGDLKNNLIAIIQAFNDVPYDYNDNESFVGDVKDVYGKYNLLKHDKNYDLYKKYNIFTEMQVFNADTMKKNKNFLIWSGEEKYYSFSPGSKEEDRGNVRGRFFTKDKKDLKINEIEIGDIDKTKESNLKIKGVELKKFGKVDAIDNNVDILKIDNDIKSVIENYIDWLKSEESITLDASKILKNEDLFYEFLKSKGIVKAGGTVKEEDVIDLDNYKISDYKKYIKKMINEDVSNEQINKKSFSFNIYINALIEKLKEDSSLILDYDSLIFESKFEISDEEIRSKYNDKARKVQSKNEPRGISKMTALSNYKNLLNIGWHPFLSSSIGSILQSVIGMITFQAYTNQTRFLWAYPSVAVSDNDKINSSLISLATAVAGAIYIGYFNSIAKTAEDYKDVRFKLMIVVFVIMLLYFINSSGYDKSTTTLTIGDYLSRFKFKYNNTTGEMSSFDLDENDSVVKIKNKYQEPITTQELGEIYGLLASRVYDKYNSAAKLDDVDDKFIAYCEEVGAFDNSTSIVGIFNLLVFMIGCGVFGLYSEKLLSKKDSDNKNELSEHHSILNTLFKSNLLIEKSTTIPSSVINSNI